LTAFESATGVTTFMLAYAVVTDTESASFTYIPSPSSREFFFAPLTRNETHST
jgi:hypothetical protein